MPFPNEDTQFKPGVSGNPAGKPKGTKHINTWVQELLNDDDFEAWIYDARSGVKEFKGAPLPAIIKAQITKAINGDTKAYDALIKSGWAQRAETDITSGGEKLGVALSDDQAAQLLKARTNR